MPEQCCVTFSGGMLAIVSFLNSCVDLHTAKCRQVHGEYRSHVGRLLVTTLMRWEALGCDSDWSITSYFHCVHQSKPHRGKGKNSKPSKSSECCSRQTDQSVQIRRGFTKTFFLYRKMFNINLFWNSIFSCVHLQRLHLCICSNLFIAFGESLVCMQQFLQPKTIFSLSSFSGKINKDFGTKRWKCALC